MDPYYIQRLRDEVIYLHSLWHQGPPSRSFPITNLPPLNSTRFKKPKKKNKKLKPKKVGSFSGKEWPVKPPAESNPPLTQSGWPELKLKPNPARLPTPEELAKYRWNQVQQKALKAANDFFSKNLSDDEEEDDHDDDMDEDEDDDSGGGPDDEGYDFFRDLFDKDEELKAYYVKHCGGRGEFSCLVCCGANEKFGKRFKDCIALVQHTVSIAKTKKRRSHRAYGQVICKVLGWDIDRLPSSIVLQFKPGESQPSQGNENGKCLDVGVTDGGATKVVDGDSMVYENSSHVANVEDTGKQVLNEAEGNAEAAANNLGADGEKDLNLVMSEGGLSKIVDGEESNLGEDTNASQKTDDVRNPVENESMVCENSSAVAIEDTEKQVLKDAQGTAGGVNNLCRNLSATMVLEHR